MVVLTTKVNALDDGVYPLVADGVGVGVRDGVKEGVIEECAAFPKGDNDDLVDSTVQAISRFRAGNFVALDDDEADEPSTQLEFEYY